MNEQQDDYMRYLKETRALQKIMPHLCIIKIYQFYIFLSNFKYKEQAFKIVQF